MSGENERFTARIVLYSYKNASIMLTLKSAKIQKIALETKEKYCKI